MWAGDGPGALAVAGNRFLGAWSSPRLSVFARIGGTTTDIPLGMRPGRQSVPRVAANGDDVLAVWQAGIRSAGAFLRNGVTVRDLDLGSSRAPDVAFDGEHYLVVTSSLAARLLRADGTDVREIALPSIAPQNETPRVAAAPGGGFVVVWQSFFTPAHARISAALVSRDGILLTPRPIDVMPEAAFHRAPAVAAMGEEFLVAAVALDDVRITRLSRFGEPLESTLLPEHADSVSIAASSSDAMVVWTSGTSVFATRLDRHLTPGERMTLSTNAVLLGADVLYEHDGYTFLLGEKDLVVVRNGTRIAVTSTEDWEYSPAAALAADGLAVVYSRGERVFLRQLSRIGRAERELTRAR